MKTTMTISIEKDIKVEFQEFAKDMGTNPTTLLSMFMRDATRKRRVEFGDYGNNEVLFESFSKNELQDLHEDVNIQKNAIEMKRLLAHV